jgi:hypothetical protein
MYLMKKIKLKKSKIITLFTLLLIACSTLAIEANQTFVLGSDNEFKVEGTSTLHDWDMVSKEAEGKAVIKLGNGKIDDLPSLEITLPSETLKSGRRGMDNNAYKALKTDQYSNIRFVLQSVEEITGQTVKAKGRLTVAGNSRDVTIEAHYRATSNNIRFIGKLEIKFSDFDIEPPTAMLGSVKTGDELEISFNAMFNLSN